MSDEDKQVKNKDINEENEEQTKKKSRRFHPKEFRQQLLTKFAYNSIKEFVQLCTQEDSHDYALEFIESGGDCSEILRVLETSENKNALYLLPVIEAFSIVLLKIIAYQPQKQYHAENTCRELLNKHFTIVKSMLALSSNKIQRKVILKLLTAMVTLSPKMGKEVLLQLHFDEFILQILTNPNAEDGNTVRTHFIQFLVSFLITEDSELINIFLKKQFLLQSIFPNIIYDTTEIVNVVLSTLQKHILVNVQISKTAKMKLFNQKIIQNIINLFNWKGPQNWNKLKKKNSGHVNTEDKQLVCEIAYEFLLVLCASRHGVIFLDPTLGFGNGKVNSLMSNVLQSLRKPWNNIFESELVIQICVSCPDLVQEVLCDTEPSLVIRDSNFWLNVIRFIKTLIEKLEPRNIEKYLIKFSSKQLFNYVQTFCAPEFILKIISSGGVTHDHIGIRYESILLLLVTLNSVDRYLSCINNLPDITLDNKSLLKESVMMHLIKNVPTTSLLLKDWRKHSAKESTVPVPDIETYLSLLLDVLNKYKILCPELIEQFKKDYDILNFFEEIKQMKNEEIQIKVIELLMFCNSSAFLPSKDLFSYAFPLLLKVYFQSSDNLKNKIEYVLHKMLTVSGLFEGCNHEIKILLHSILELDSCDESFGNYLTLVFKDLSENFVKYNSDLSVLIDSIDNYNTFIIKDFLKSLQEDGNKTECTEIIIKHKTFSPLILGLLDGLLKPENSNMSSYVSKILTHLLFSLTSSKLLISLFLKEKYKLIINPRLIKYCKHSQDISSIKHLKSLLISETLFSKIFNFIVNDEEESIPNNDGSSHYYCITLLTNFVIYFYTESVLQQNLDKRRQKKCVESIEYIINLCDDNISLQNCLNSILRHPVLLQTFSPTYDNKQTIENMCTEFVIHVIEGFLKTKTKTELELYLSPYRSKVIHSIRRILKTYENNKLESTGKLIEVIHLFELNFEQCTEIIKITSALPHTCYIENNNISIVPKILSYILNKDFNLKPFENDVIKQISYCITKLNQSNNEIHFEDLENSFCNYITKFPSVNINFNTHLFDSLLKKTVIHKSTINLATILIKYNKVLIKQVESQLNNILEKRELVFSLLDVIKDLNLPSVKSILSIIYKEYDQTILKFINKPQKIPNYLSKHYSVIVILVNEFMSDENCDDITDKIQKFDVTEDYHALVLSSIFIKSINSEEDNVKKIKIITNYISTIIHLLLNILKKTEKSEEDWTKIENICKHFGVNLTNIENYSDETFYKNATFQNFSKFCLKFGLQGKPILIKVLQQLYSLTQDKNENFGMIFEMAISHSESLNILLSNNELKAPFLKLLLVLCKKCPNVMAKSHIPVWLGAYGATLLESDQYLLQLLVLYEQANIGFHEYKPYLWGTVAVEHYSVLSGGFNNLWRLPTPINVLDILSEEKIMKTIVNFPQTRELIPEESIYSGDELDVYDPAFFLPLLSHLLAPESIARWFNFKNRGIICLAIICLTSNCKDVRAAACHVFERFHYHLTAATYAKERVLWQHLVEAICRGTSILPKQKLSSIVGVFLCRCAIKFNIPEDFFYKPLVNYISAKECPNFNVVPELLEMFFNTSLKFKAHKIFILEVMRDGLKSKIDLKVMFRSMAFKLIMDFYNSTLANSENQKIILEILSSAVSIFSGATLLIANCSLLSWLQTILHQINFEDTNLIIAFINILNNLAKLMHSRRLRFQIFKILALQVSMIDILQNSQVELCDAVKFVESLYLIYEHRPNILNKRQLCNLIEYFSKFFDCNICNYYLEYGIDFVQKPIYSETNEMSICRYYLEMLTLKWIESNDD